MEIRRIEAGILDNGTGMDRTMNPFQSGLGAFIDLDKEGFVGREALLSVDRETLIYGLKCEGAAPDIGCHVVDSREIVGRVTAGAWSPYLRSGIGYVRFNEPAKWTGKVLSIETRAGTIKPCTIVDLPF